jgi:hypothetical protein
MGSIVIVSSRIPVTLAIIPTAIAYRVPSARIVSSACTIRTMDVSGVEHLVSEHISLLISYGIIQTISGIRAPSTKFVPRPPEGPSSLRPSPHHFPSITPFTIWELPPTSDVHDLCDIKSGFVPYAIGTHLVLVENQEIVAMSDIFFIKTALLLTSITFGLHIPS